MLYNPHRQEVLSKAQKRENNYSSPLLPVPIQTNRKFMSATDKSKTSNTVLKLDAITHKTADWSGGLLHVRQISMCFPGFPNLTLARFMYVFGRPVSKLSILNSETDCFVWITFDGASV